MNLPPPKDAKGRLAASLRIVVEALQWRASSNEEPGLVWNCGGWMSQRLDCVEALAEVSRLVFIMTFWE